MRLTSLASLIVSLCLAATFTVGASAQNKPIPQDTYYVDYFSNANTAGAPDGTLRITNPGETYTNLCAYIAVFDANEEMSECCGCLVTPDGLATLSIDTDLTDNPLTGTKLQDGIVKIVSAAPIANTCPLPTGPGQAPALTPGLRSWSTHIQNGSSGFVITEGDSQESNLSRQEIFNLGAQCADILLVGSGKGICTCGTGGNT